MSRARFIALSVIVDAIAYHAVMVAAFLLRFSFTLPPRNFEPYLTLAPFLTVVFLLAAYANGLYDPERIEGVWQVVQGSATASTLALMLTLGVLYLLGTSFSSFPRTVILMAWPLQFLLLVGWRVLSTRITPIRWPEQRVLIVGTGPVAVELAAELTRRAKWGYRVVGLVARDEDSGGTDAWPALRPDDPAGPPPRIAPEPPVLGSVSQLTALVRAHDVDRVIAASPVALRELFEDVTLSGEGNVRVDVVPELYEIFIGEVDSIVADIPLMEITHRHAQWYASVKRFFDIFWSLLLLVLLSPVLLLAGLAILLTTGWPVFFNQERLGKDLRPFSVHKFRTMVRDAEAKSGPVLAEEEDPRITPVGRVLRKTRIDELPQLVNILLGDMSFVGPRPERAFFVEQYLREIPGYRERFRMKPGATGLAQVSGGYATTPERKLKYDLIYLYHQNVLMDVRIVVDTIRVVLTGHGAR